MATHEVKLILMFEELAIHPSIQNRSLYPFTDDVAEKFFNVFYNMSFEFEGEFRTVYLYDAKENSPKHSYATGWLFEDDLEQVNAYQRQHGKLPK